MEMKKKYHLTILDDDKNYLEILRLSLEASFQVTHFNEALDALNFLYCSHTDAVILDLHLVGTTGFDVCRQIKSLKPDLPVFFLTNDTDIQCIQKGFSLGGLDYFTKSLSMSELMTRILERIRLHFLPQSKSVVGCGDVRIDLMTNRAFHHNRELRLTPKEYELLKLFIECQNKVISKKDILHSIWPQTHVDQNNIDTHLYNLRKKLKECSTQIECLKGRGFLLKA